MSHAICCFDVDQLTNKCDIHQTNRERVIRGECLCSTVVLAVNARKGKCELAELCVGEECGDGRHLANSGEADISGTSLFAVRQRSRPPEY